MTVPASSTTVAASASTVAGSPLAHLIPGWFATVMGWCGLSLVWLAAVPLLGPPARMAAQAAASVSALLFVVVGVAFALRAWRHAAAMKADLAHPIRSGFFAAITASLMLLGTLATYVAGADMAWVKVLWLTGSVSHLLVTVWVLARWLAPAPGGLQWAAMTPVLFIPVVANVLAPLAGHSLGLGAWASMQFGVGLLLWPVLLTLVLVRLGQAGPLPPRMLPTWLILVAPPAVIGLAAQALAMPDWLPFSLWGMASFFLAWSLTRVRSLSQLPFGIPHWALSFPLAAWASLTLTLARTPEGAWLSVPALAGLLAVNLLLLCLSLATLKGLWRGTLLVPEPMPPVAPAGTAPLSTRPA